MPFPVPLSKLGSLAGRPVLKGIALIRKVPWVDDWINRRELLSPVFVRRVQDPNDLDLSSALDLYEKRIPDGFRFERADIIRWLIDDCEERDGVANRPRDYFLVVKVRRQVRGFALLHYYPKPRTAFFAYMVADAANSKVPMGQLTHKLATHLGRMFMTDELLRQAEKIVFEVEDPRKASAKKRREALARIRIFCALAATQRVPLVALGIDYRQPQSIFPADDSPEDDPLLLLCARLKSKIAWTRDDATDVLRFIYLDLYPEGFSHIPAENEAYKQYCARLFAKAQAALPEEVTVLNPAHLR